MIDFINIKDKMQCTACEETYTYYTLQVKDKSIPICDNCLRKLLSEIDSKRIDLVVDTVQQRSHFDEAVAKYLDSTGNQCIKDLEDVITEQEIEISSLEDENANLKALLDAENIDYD